MKNLVIIPTYNEADNIVKIIPEVLKQDESVHVLVVDDNSPDGTAYLTEQMSLNESRIHLLKRDKKLGLGSAYVAGFRYALENGFDYIIEMDADFSHNPDVLPRMLKEAENNDLVIGSRYVEGINVVNWPLSRLILSYGAAQYVKIITGMGVKDPTGGFKCFKRKVLESINLDEIISDGYSFQVEMNYRAWNKKFKIKEIPIIFEDRRSGQSKMSKKIVREALVVVWKLRYLQLTGKL
ncbi:MAG: dolichyl-phosphate beta-D-mannosyltransferase [Candidatus Cloacimonadota bacterium]|nr:MAG: dolichyl-phosphate beta-D-mannosyltransferase [Candidatus Cloacimonadota bacterium]